MLVLLKLIYVHFKLWQIQPKLIENSTFCVFFTTLLCPSQVSASAALGRLTIVQPVSAGRAGRRLRLN